MADIARFIARFLLKDETAETLCPDVIRFRRGYQDLHFIR